MCLFITVLLVKCLPQLFACSGPHTQHTEGKQALETSYAIGDSAILTVLDVLWSSTLQGLWAKNKTLSQSGGRHFSLTAEWEERGFWFEAGTDINLDSFNCVKLVRLLDLLKAPYRKTKILTLDWFLRTREEILLSSVLMLFLSLLFFLGDRKSKEE